jgi:CubicO group peptidase (beta-lactamase class C family)
VGLRLSGSVLERIDAEVQALLIAARIPGAALAIVAEGSTVHAKGYGYRDLARRLPMNAQTAYPIASTTKALNATLIGMLVDEGSLAWDTPVQTYLPWFRLRDAAVSMQVTLRDLIVMRTGLPRHDWLWIGHAIERASLIERMRHLDCSFGFRERFQYNNLTTAAAGYVAETVTGRCWEELIRSMLLEPLSMTSTVCTPPDLAWNLAQGENSLTAGSTSPNITCSYHETVARELVRTQRMESQSLLAPAGSAIHSTIEDMARWAAFNLEGGTVQGKALIKPKTLADIHAPELSARFDPSCPTPHAGYGMGWFIDTHHGHLRIGHGGYLDDVNGEVSLYPEHHFGVISCTNFGCPHLARVINQYVFELALGVTHVETYEDRLVQYERDIKTNQARLAAVPRRTGTMPSHVLEAYTGRYTHPAYGTLEITVSDTGLQLRRQNLSLSLEHWHYEAWVTHGLDELAIHEPHAFDTASRVLFETDADGAVAAVSLPLEPAVAPIRFARAS